MKTRISFLLIGIFLMSGMSISAAKKKHFSGKITYKITVSDDLPEQARAMMPKTMTLYVGKNKVKTEMFTQMGMQSSIEDLENKTKISLLEIMGQKFAIHDSWEDLKEEMKNEPEVKIDRTGETRGISGYTCEKIIVKKVEDGEVYAIAWVTSELDVPDNINFSNPAFNDISEMMLEFEMDAGNGMMLTFTAIEVDDKKVKDKEFEVPEDFEETTREKLQQTFGG